MRFITQTLLFITLLAIAGCSDAHGSAQGDTTDRDSSAHVEVGVPF